MKNFHINWNGDATSPPDIDKYETAVGTRFRFFMNEVGDLATRRVIPVRFVGAY